MANKNPDKSGLMPAWSATNQPAGAGRKPSKLKKYLKDNGVCSDDVSAMAKYILPMTQQQIIDLIKNEKVPIIMKVFAKGVLADMKNSNFRNLMILLDRAVGTPEQNININSKNTNVNRNMNLEDLTEEEAKAEFFRKIAEANED